MSGKQYSPEFLHMQTRSKADKKNPNYGVRKSSSTLAKIIKLVYVYNSEDMNYIGSFPTVVCSKTFKLGKDTPPPGQDQNILNQVYLSRVKFIQEKNYINNKFSNASINPLKIY